MEATIREQLAQSYIQKSVLLMDTNKKEFRAYELTYCRRFHPDIAKAIVERKIQEYVDYLNEHCLR